MQLSTNERRSVMQHNCIPRPAERERFEKLAITLSEELPKRARNQRAVARLEWLLRISSTEDRTIRVRKITRMPQKGLLSGI